MAILMCLGGLAMNAQQIPRYGLDRDDIFKREIQFEARAKRVSVLGGIVGTSLPNPAMAPQIQEGWSLQQESISNGQKELLFRKKDERLSIVFYYAVDIEIAKNKLFQIATNTNMTVIPYQLGPSGLGDISLIGKFKVDNRVMFLKKNIVVDIRRDHSEVDIMGLAHWIHNHLKLVPVEEVTKQIPTPGKILTSRTRDGVEAPMAFRPNEAMTTIRAQVGEPLVIRIDPPAGTDANRYDLEQNLGGYFHPVGMEGLGPLEQAIKPLKPGLAVYKYVLIDRQTLLSYPGEINIDVQP